MGFHCVRGFAFDSVTRLEKRHSASEMRDLTELHSARNFMRSKGDFKSDANIAQVDYVPP